MSRRVIELEDLGAFDRHVRAAHSLQHCFIQSLDLTGRGEQLAQVRTAGAVFLGCRFPDGMERRLQRYGALIFPTLPQVPFDPYRARLYDADELYGPAHPDGVPEHGHGAPSYAHTLDAQVYAWAKRWRRHRDLDGSLAVALHDHAVTDALDDVMRTIPPDRVVGVMGGHAMRRDTAAYAGAARLGRELTRLGATVLTGGGPGAMEAANLGAYLTGHERDWPAQALDEALNTLSSAPLPDVGADGWLTAAREVRRRRPPQEAGRSVGIPTWFYGHEPPNLFAAAIAKYFLNPLREDTLLHRCRGGLICLPGAAGTVQEIFQAGTENYYAADESLVAPIVLVGREHWTSELPAWPLLQALGRDRALGQHIHLVDDPAEALRVLDL